MRGIISGYAGHRFLIPATRDQRKKKINTYWKQNGSHLIHAMGVDTHCFLTKHLIYSQPTLQWRDIEATRFPIQRTAWRRPGRVWPRITPGSRDTIRDVRTGSRSKCCSRAARRKKNLHKRLITLITFKKQPILLIHNDLCGVSQAIVSIVSNCLQKCLQVASLSWEKHRRCTAQQSHCARSLTWRFAFRTYGLLIQQFHDDKNYCFRSWQWGHHRT